MIINDIKTSEEFYDIIKKYNKVLIKFYSVSCGPCKKLQSILEKEELDIPIFKLDAMEFFKFSDEYSISAVPTIIYFKDSEPVHKFYGIVNVDKLREITE